MPHGSREDAALPEYGMSRKLLQSELSSVPLIAATLSRTIH